MGFVLLSSSNPWFSFASKSFHPKLFKHIVGNFEIERVTRAQADNRKIKHTKTKWNKTKRRFDENSEKIGIVEWNSRTMDWYCDNVCMRLNGGHANEPHKYVHTHRIRSSDCASFWSLRRIIIKLSSCFSCEESFWPFFVVSFLQGFVTFYTTSFYCDSKFTFHHFSLDRSVIKVMLYGYTLPVLDEFFRKKCK